MKKKYVYLVWRQVENDEYYEDSQVENVEGCFSNLSAAKEWVENADGQFEYWDGNGRFWFLHLSKLDKYAISEYHIEKKELLSKV